jgi:hypothetical protein
MSRRFTLVTVALTALVAFLVGAIVAGGVARSTISAGAPAKTAGPRLASSRAGGAPALASLVNFADVVERINPAVVNIDATTRGRESRRRRGRSGSPDGPDPFDGPFDFGTRASASRRAAARAAASSSTPTAASSPTTTSSIAPSASRSSSSDGRTVRAR